MLSNITAITSRIGPASPTCLPQLSGINFLKNQVTLNSFHKIKKSRVQWVTVKESIIWLHRYLEDNAESKDHLQRHLYKALMNGFLEFPVPFYDFFTQIWVIKRAMYAFPQVSHHITKCTNYCHRWLTLCCLSERSSNAHNVYLHVRAFQDILVIKVLN